MKRLPTWLVTLFSFIGLAALFLGSWIYISNVREALWILSVTNLKQITAQAGHAFEIYLQKDLQGIHDMAVIMGKADSDDLDYLEGYLDAYGDSLDEAVFSVVDEKTGMMYSNRMDEFGRPMSETSLEAAAQIADNMVTEPFLSEINGLRVMSCQERFTFADGVQGIIRKEFPVSKVVDEFVLDVYDGEGFSYIVNADGDILVRSIHRNSSHTYQNVFDAMAMGMGQGKDSSSIIEEVRTAMAQGRSGTVRCTTDQNVEFVYAYVPIKETDGWYYITVVPSKVLLEQSNHILNISQLFIFLTAMGIILILVVILLVRKTNKAMQRIKGEVLNREKLFDILTNGTGDAFVMFTVLNKTVDYVSPNIERLLGVSAEEVKNDVTVLWDGEVTGSDITDQLSQLQMGASISLERRWLDRRTEAPLWVSVTIYRAEIDKAERAIIVFSDRTAEKNREDALKDATNIAESANRAKSAFLSNMSHDIRTPMNAIIGLCTLMERDVSNPEAVKNHTRKMKASCQHLLGLINDILDMSKIEAGKTSLNIGEINLAEIVEELITVMSPQAHAKGQSFEVNATDICSEHLLGDKLRINQVLMNILSNAIKYTPEGGSVEMLVQEMPQKSKGFAHMRFVVKDNGRGISAEYMQSIFQPFTREIESNMNQIQGTGLGMAITKSLVDLMEGNISVESEVGKGSIFTVDLDLRIQDRETEQEFWNKCEIEKVLVVDDELDSCLYVASTLERAGIKVEYVLNGEAAIERAQKEYAAGMPFQLILMDMRMPGLDGVETTRRIRRAVPGNYPVLAFTYYDWNDVQEKAVEAGINGFLSKPFFLSNLEQGLEKLHEQPVVRTQQEESILKGMHILVAEDNIVNSEILEELLSMYGATCDIEENGEKALHRFTASKPDEYDLILMDIHMPVMNGYEATRAIRKCGHPRAASIPILAMTADVFAEDVRRAIEAGMNAHVAKPLDMKRLEQAIREVL